MRAIRHCLAMLSLLIAAPALAHLTPNSEVGLSIGRTTATADIVIPLGEVLYAEPAFQSQDPALWLLRHVDLRAPDGRRWRVTVESVTTNRDGVPDLTARLRMVPPRGALLRRFVLRYDAVLDRVPGHFALLWLKDDYDGGRLGSRPKLLAALRRDAPQASVDLGVLDGWRGFRAAIELGMKHIAEGHDHLLFLIGLLLPAPLLAVNRRWGGYAGARHMLGSLLAIVTAFTVGHSLTLIGGALFGWQLPSQPVEALIAVSILITALHAWRPIFAGREAAVAAGFGLVHGMAFATVIGHFALDPWPRAQAILGFNLGIELVQLLVVVAIAPPLTLLARAGRYRVVRTGGALFIGTAAILWLIERLSGAEFAPARWLDQALSYAPYGLLPVLAISSLWAWRTSGSHPPPDRR